METQADHGAITEAETQTTLKEVQAAAVTTAVAGATVAERMHCTAYIKLLKMFAKVHNAKGLSMWRHTQFPYFLLISACFDGSSVEVFSTL